MFIPFFVFLVPGPTLRLENLASPLRLIYLDAESHQGDQIRAETSNFLFWYRKLSEPERRELILTWFNRIQPRIDKYISNRRDDGFVISEFPFTQDKSECDLAKLDLLLLTIGQPPIFHTTVWNFHIYGVTAGAKFGTFEKHWRIEPYGEMARYGWGPRNEPDDSCFDWFMADQRKDAIEWILGGMNEGAYISADNSVRAKLEAEWSKESSRISE